MNNLPIGQDREENTRLLMSLPGIADTVALQVGNAIIIPRQPGDGDWKQFTCEVDGKPVIFITPETTVEPRSMNPYPISAFTPTGIAHLFRHADPPPIFIAMVAKLLEYEQCKLCQQT